MPDSSTPSQKRCAGGAVVQGKVSENLGRAGQGTESQDAGDMEAAGSSSKIAWKGLGDVDDPHSWSFGKKAFHTAIPALYGFVITVGTSVYVPAVPFVMVEFDVSREVGILGVSMYTAGFIFGPMIAAPLSEIYGRRIVYWITLPLLLIFTGIAGSANNITTLVVMRLLAGLGGSGALAIGAGTIADLWNHKSGGRAAISFIMAPFLGPALGPLIGAYIIHEYNNDWRYSMWVVIMIAAPIVFMAAIMMETSKTRILYLREKKSGVQAERQAGDTRFLLQKLYNGLITPLHMMTMEPLVALLSIYTAFAFAMMFSFFGSYTYVYTLIYHFSSRSIGLCFLGILVGFIFAVISFALFDATLYARASIAAKQHGAKPAPEHRLYAGMLGSVMLPIGLFWFAWAPRKGVHWIVPVLAGVPFGWGSLAIFISATTYLVDVYQAKNGASAVAANGILRYAFGAAFPLFTIQMYEKMGVHWAGTVFGFIGLALMPVPWVFFWKGKQLRARSRYETSQF